MKIQNGRKTRHQQEATHWDHTNKQNQLWNTRVINTEPNPREGGNQPVKAKSSLSLSQSEVFMSFLSRGGVSVLHVERGEDNLQAMVVSKVVRPSWWWSVMIFVCPCTFCCFVRPFDPQKLNNGINIFSQSINIAMHFVYTVWHFANHPRRQFSLLP